MSTKTYTIYDGKILVNEGKNKTTYYYRTTIEGQRKKINLGNDRNLALQKLREIEQHGEIQPKTVDHVWDSYSKTKLLERADKTIKDYTLRYKTLRKIFGNMRMEDIKPWHVVKYMDERKKYLVENAKDGLKQVAGVSANREIAILSILFGYAINRLKMKLINPCNGIERVKEHGRKKYVEKWEYEKIYEAGDHLFQDGMDLLLFTGLRISDMLKLKISDIKRDMDLNEIHMPSGKLASEELGKDKGDILRIKPNKTKDTTEVIIDLVIEGEFKKIIDRILERRTKNKIESIYLISDNEGQPVSYYVFYNKYRKARDLAGYKSFAIQIRDLRHKNSVDSNLIDANVRLGHSSIAMTEKYRNVLVGKMARPITKLK